MSYVRKNIFGFATIAATVTLSAAIFATGCGDSGDSTAVNPLNPDKIANAITVNYDADTEAALKSSNVESLRWLITDTESGKQFASRDTVQKINYTGTATKANAALAEENTTSDGTTADKTPTSATKNDKCYVVLGVPSTVFQNMTNVTVTAIYYDKDGHVVGFGSDINDVTWNTDKSGKKFSGTITDGNFFSEKDAQYSLTAAPEFIKKYDEELAKKDPKATQADAFTTLAYNVTDGTTTANIIGLVDIDNYKDIKDYIQPEEVKAGEYPTPGRYKGVAYTPADGATVRVKLDRASVSGDTQNTKVYVTDRTIAGFTLDVTTEFNGSTSVLVPDNVPAKGDVKAADYSLNQKKVKLFKDGQLDKLNCAVRNIPLEIYGIEWSDGEGQIPNISIANNFDMFNFGIANKDTSKAISDSEVSVSKDGILQFKQESITGELPIVVTASYANGTKTVSDHINIKAVHADVKVGFQTYDTDPGVVGLLSEISKDKDLGLFASFVTADGAFSGPFPVESSMFSTGNYPQAKLFTKGASNAFADYTGTTIKVAQDSNKKDMYKVTIAEENQDKDVYMRFGKDDAEQSQVFSPFTAVKFADLVIKPSI